VPLTTAHREAVRLIDAGLIRERHVGRARLVPADPAGRYTRPLTELLTLAFGPHLVIGEVAHRDLYEAAERAEQRLGLQVNPALCSRSRWIAAADPLLQQIRSAPVVWVTGEPPREEDR